MTDAVARRPRRRTLLVVIGMVLVAVGLGGCIAPAPRAAPGTTVLGPRDFCDPLRAAAPALFTARDRSRLIDDLVLARAGAPRGMQPPLDSLIALEREHVNPVDAAAGGATDRAAPTGATAPAVPGGTPRPLDSWFDALRQLDGVARAECAVDVAAGLPAPGRPSVTVPGTAAASSGASSGPLTFTDIEAMVRAARPDARWVEDGLSGAVGSGAVRKVMIEAVDDPERARGVCIDVFTVLVDQPPPPVVEIRSSAGLVVAESDGTTCQSVPGR